MIKSGYRSRNYEISRIIENGVKIIQNSLIVHIVFLEFAISNSMNE